MDEYEIKHPFDLGRTEIRLGDRVVLTSQGYEFFRKRGGFKKKYLTVDNTPEGYAVEKLHRMIQQGSMTLTRHVPVTTAWQRLLEDDLV